MQLTSNTMTSLQMADLTGMTHANLMKAIRKMEESWVKVNGVKFYLVEYTDRKGERRPMYQLTKTECLYIATKFNDEARAKLVLRWEELEKQATKPLSPAEQLLANAQLLVEQERRVSQVEQDVRELKAKTTTRPDYFTIAGYGSLNGYKLNMKLASKLGAAASRLCKNRNIPIDKIPDPRFGTVGMYPTSIIQEVFHQHI